MSTFPESAPRPFSFSGTLDGPEGIDLISLSGLALSEAEIERIWSSTNARALLAECPSLTEIETGEADDVPGQSERFFHYEAPSREQLASEHRSVITERLKL